MKIHIWNQTKAHTMKHNMFKIHTQIKKCFFIFGYYYCSNGRGVREQETNNPHDDKEKKNKKNNFMSSSVLTGLRHK